MRPPMNAAFFANELLAVVRATPGLTPQQINARTGIFPDEIRSTVSILISDRLVEHREGKLFPRERKRKVEPLTWRRQLAEWRLQ